MAGFLFRLETAAGEPADAAERRAELAPWRHDPLGRRTLRVLDVRDGEPPVLVVEDIAG